MKDPGEIVALWQSRRAEQSPLYAKMRAVAEHYHDDVVLPLPELDSSETYSVPNMVAQSIDQYAFRISSVLPDMDWPALDPTKTRSVKLSQQRRQVAFGWWEASTMKRQIEQRARWLRGYGQTPVIVVPDYRLGVPRYEARNPCLALPAPKMRPWDVEVADCIFTYKWTIAQLQERYGVTFSQISRKGTFPLSDDAQVECIEYLDADSWTLLVLGPSGSQVTTGTGYSSREENGITNVRVVGDVSPGNQLVVLDQTRHDLGMCPVSVPGKFGLERIAGSVDGMLGLRGLQARLMALEVLAVERAIFPNEWAVLDPTGNSEVIRLADGRAGIVGEIRGGQMHVTRLEPGQMTTNTINYLERAQRQNGLLPAEWGGEAASNIRTGRRGEQVLSATVDQSLRADHELFAESLQHENRIAVAWAKKMRKPTSVYVSWNGTRQQIDYTAAELFENDRNIVTYAQAGADISQLIVNSAQLQGTELISQDTARRINPLIDDPEHERQQVNMEKIDRAIFSGFEQAVTTQQIALPDATYVRKLMGDGMDIGEAIEKAQRRAQERQASNGPPGQPTGPVEPGAPEAQPGLQPGSPSAAGVAAPTVPQTGESQTNLANLLRSLATTSRAANAGG